MGRVWRHLRNVPLMAIVSVLLICASVVSYNVLADPLNHQYAIVLLLLAHCAMVEVAFTYERQLRRQSSAVVLIMTEQQYEEYLDKTCEQDDA